MKARGRCKEGMNERGQRAFHLRVTLRRYPNRESPHMELARPRSLTCCEFAPAEGREAAGGRGEAPFVVAALGPWEEGDAVGPAGNGGRGDPAPLLLASAAIVMLVLEEGRLAPGERMEIPKSAPTLRRTPPPGDAPPPRSGLPGRLPPEAPWALASSS